MGYRHNSTSIENVESKPQSIVLSPSTQLPVARFVVKATKTDNVDELAPPIRLYREWRSWRVLRDFLRPTGLPLAANRRR